MDGMAILIPTVLVLFVCSHAQQELALILLKLVFLLVQIELMHKIIHVNLHANMDMLIMIQQLVILIVI